MAARVGFLARRVCRCDFVPLCVSFSQTRSIECSLPYSRRTVPSSIDSDITDFITPDEALELLRSKQAGKAQRLAKLKEKGYPAYTTSVGW